MDCCWANNLLKVRHRLPVGLSKGKGITAVSSPTELNTFVDTAVLSYLEQRKKLQSGEDDTDKEWGKGCRCRFSEQY